MGHVLVYLLFKRGRGPHSGLFVVQEGLWAMFWSICCLKGLWAIFWFICCLR